VRPNTMKRGQTQSGEKGVRARDRRLPGPARGASMLLWS
jgi:hypothetical protein